MIRYTVASPNTGVPSYRNPTIGHLPTMSRPYHQEPPGPSPLRNTVTYSTDPGSNYTSSQQSRRADSGSGQESNGKHFPRRYGHRSVSEASGRDNNTHFTEDLSTAQHDEHGTNPIEQALTDHDEHGAEHTPAETQAEPARPRLRRRLTKSHLSPYLNKTRNTDIGERGIEVDAEETDVIEGLGSRSWWASKKRRARAWLTRMGWRRKGKPARSRKTRTFFVSGHAGNKEDVQC